MTKTVGKLVAEFKKVYRLTDGSFDAYRHDAIHVMTGFGIGIAEELRIAAVECALNYKATNLKDPYWVSPVYERQKNLHQTLKSWMINGTYLNADENGLNQAKFQRAQIRSKPLATGEVRALFNLGVQMRAAIKKLTGRNYICLTSKRLAEIDFRDIDFTAAAQEIKQKYQKPVNAAVEKQSAQILHAAEIKVRKRALIPAAGTPWHGRLKQTMPQTREQ